MLIYCVNRVDIFEEFSCILNLYSQTDGLWLLIKYYLVDTCKLVLYSYEYW